jgi:hypothetical protein
MKLPATLRLFIFPFVIALAIYVVSYSGIEHRRTRDGPWQITFTNVSGSPALVINEPKLNLANITLTFPGEPPPVTNSVMIFDPPRAVPFDVPFGQCVFLDTTFQPGTIVLNLFGHEIQLLPRVLTIDKQEHAWESGTTTPVGHGQAK